MKRMSMMLVFLLFVTVGCTRSAITVDDERVSKELFNLVLKERLESHKALNAKIDEKAVKKAVSEELVAQTLLVKEAVAKKIGATGEEVQKTIDSMRGSASEKDFREKLKTKDISYNILLEKVRNDILVSKLLDSLVKEDEVTEDAMKEFYTKRQLPFIKPEKEFVSILQINTAADAEKAVDELKKGADFDTVAKNMAKSGNSAATDYGWIDPDTFPSKELAMAMKTAKLNVFRGPYKGRDGSYYIFKIKERQIAQVLPYEEVKLQIRNMILNQRRQELARHIIETGRKTAKIKINI
ncbi:MAG: peptidyl-prolyl cis-trans isomerase [Nitrospirae bacterium]|nr:peptidyl-prolyl cis-trans isomerase [Nitrospirota bacterium]